MNHLYYCPHCDEELLTNLKGNLKCPSCKRCFVKDFIEKLDKEDILFTQELSSILDIFSELGDVRKIKEF